jgi:hypothetical protein
MSDDKYVSEFATDYDTKLGHIHDGTKSRSKKVFKWTFNIAGTDGNPLTIPIDVYLMQSKNEWRGKGSKPLRFSASHEYTTELFEDSDIDKLKKAVEADLRDKVEAIQGTKWEDWLEVRVSGRTSEFGYSSFAGMGAALEMKILKLKRGLHPTTGMVLTIHRNKVCIPFPKGQKLSDVDPHSRLGFQEGEVSYIKETPENLAALEEVRSRMIDLKAKLADVLSQDRAQESLSNIKSLPLPERKNESIS